MTPNQRGFRQAVPAFEARPIKLLVYADDPAFVPDRPYTTRLLERAFDDGDLPGLLKVEVEVVLQSAETRLTPELLGPFHEVWFFLKAKKGATLADDERRALLAWMDRGNGVLVAGDHADEKDRETYDGLGAGVGGSIPRARHMRYWDDRPGQKAGTVADTTVFTYAQRNEKAYKLELDAVPQRLLLPAVDDRQPHSIFLDAQKRPLEWFPDHGHEGEVKVAFDPAVALAGEWPDGTLPLVVAKGINWRYGRVFDLMAVWDGHALKGRDGGTYGRIVADSSFHHYVDDNLESIAEAGGDHWRDIRLIYRNLAAWLAPPPIKRDYRDKAIAWAASHERVTDLGDAGDPALGDAMANLLAQVLPGAWLHEIVDDIANERGIGPLSSQMRAELTPYVLAAHARDLQTRACSPAQSLEAISAIDPAQSVAPASALEQALAGYVTVLERKQAELREIVSKLRPHGG